MNRTYHTFIAIYVFARIMLGCTPQPVPNPPPQPDADAAPTPPDSTPDAAADTGPAPAGGPCELAYRHAASDLKCLLKVPATGTWVQACNNAQANAIDMHTTCMVAAKDCAAVSNCLGSDR
jgi:hypothetical protein